MEHHHLAGDKSHSAAKARLAKRLPTENMPSDPSLRKKKKQDRPKRFGASRAMT